MELKELLSSIESIHKTQPRKKQAYDTYNKTPAFLSNQFDFAPVIKELLTHVSLKVPGKQNIAVLVGESFFASLSPALLRHADDIVFADVDKRVLDHNLYIIACIKKANNKDEFIKMACSPANPILKNKIPIQCGKIVYNQQGQPSYVKEEGMDEKTIYLHLLRTGIGILDGYHFLSSEETFNKAKDAVCKLRFHTLEIDLLNPDLMLKMAMGLIENNFNITLLNISNLLDYDGNFPIREVDRRVDDWRTTGTLYKAIEHLLARKEDVKIILGLMDCKKEYKALTSKIVTGISEYIDFTRAYATAVNSSFSLQMLTGNIRFFAVAYPSASFLRSREYNLKEMYAPRILEDLKSAWKDLLPELSMSCHLVKNGEHGLADILIKKSGDMSQIFSALDKHHVSYQIKTIENEEYICILDTNTPVQQKKILTLIDQMTAEKTKASTQI